MCGIIGYSGRRQAVPFLLDGLKRLEYRGYDSAGLAFIERGELTLIRSHGKLSELEKKISTGEPINVTSGIGHTRWATHGLPSERNAHPHKDNAGRIALVHNGIIENFQTLKTGLIAKGHVFHSDTDTEVLAHLIAEETKTCSTLEQAISRGFSQVEGSYAMALVDLTRPGEIFAVRCSSPLLLGIGEGENFVASDIPAFLSHTRQVVYLNDFELVHMTADTWKVMELKTLKPLTKKVHSVSFDIQAAEKGGFKHFMIKEIMEQPRVISDCLTGRIDHATNNVLLPELDRLPIPGRLQIVACGTSFHAGLWAKQLIEAWAKVPVEVEIASEYRYREHAFRPDDLVLSISQSGETADTLAGMRIAKDNGIKVLGLCNVLGSSVAREADGTVFTQAGPEISVASTKAMCSQLTLLYLMALLWGEKRKTLPAEVQTQAVPGIMSLPRLLDQALPAMQEKAKSLVKDYSDARSFFFLGRSLNYPLALEGALKLKEISYIHAEGYAAGEMKHGPIALIDQHFPSFVLAPQDDLLPKVESNIKEIQARGGKIIALTHAGTDVDVEHRWEIPLLWGPLNSFLILPALQLFAYEMAVYLGKDVDQPRNLAKSVTVE